MNKPRDHGRLHAYVAIVALSGAAVLLHAAAHLGSAPEPLEWLLFALLAVLTGSFTMKFASVQATISVSDTFYITSILLFGPAPATLTLAIASVIVSWRRRHNAVRLAFNAAAPALSLWIAGRLFFALARVQPLAAVPAPIGAVMVPLVALTAAYFLLNSGLTAIAIALETGDSPAAIWRKHFLWLSVSYLAAGSLSLCMIVFVEQVGIGATAMALPLLIVFHLTLRSSFGRLEDARSHLEHLDRLYLSTVETLAMAIDAKDDVTHSHVRRVQAYAVGLARALGIADEPMLKAIEAAALLHDTGKLAVPEHILNKPGKLTETEFDQMKLHVDVGADILSLVNFPYPVVPIVRCHHENWDGTGYPRGIAREAIPVGARILSVVDCFDALTSDRPYRRRLSDEDALAILVERRGRMYDPEVVDTFIRVYKDIPLGDIDAPEHRVVMAQIARSHAEPPAPAPADAPPPSAAAADEMFAFVSLARVAKGDAALTDVLALASHLVAGVVPGVTVAWYVPAVQGDRLIAVDAAGPAAHVVRGAAVRVGDRLSGWVAANRQPIVNSDASLDLDPSAAAASSLQSCLSVPLASGDTVAGVLTLYADQPRAFTDAQARMLQTVAPHIAAAMATARRRDEDAAAPGERAAARDLRLVSSR